MLFFISKKQTDALADLALAGETDKKAYKAAIKELPSVDMVLFGRMVASDPSLSYDAAAQVAHSISTHAAQTEFDYFTAVDDRAPEDNAGAGHLGTVEFNLVHAVPLCGGQCPRAGAAARRGAGGRGRARLRRGDGLLDADRQTELVR